MPSTKEIKNHIKSVSETQKITNAMYLIASTKLQKAKAELDKTRPYFAAVQGEIKRIFRVDDKIDNKYFYPVEGAHDFNGDYGYLVVTADKGLAGAYNQAVIKQSMQLLSEHPGKVYVIGEYGRQYFKQNNIPIEKTFMYTAQNPTLHRAREISSILIDDYNKGDIKKIFIIYTDYQGLNNAVCVERLLPFHRADFKSKQSEKDNGNIFTFEPSIGQVLDNIISAYVVGFIYSALVDSFCSEQQSRMSAMDSANTNAEKLLDDLGKQYNHTRQSDITREITEISSGARSLKLNALKHKKEL